MGRSIIVSDTRQQVHTSHVNVSQTSPSVAHTRAKAARNELMRSREREHDRVKPELVPQEGRGHCCLQLVSVQCVLHLLLHRIATKRQESCRLRPLHQSPNHRCFIKLKYLQPKVFQSRTSTHKPTALICSQCLACFMMTTPVTKMLTDADLYLGKGIMGSVAADSWLSGYDSHTANVSQHKPRLNEAKAHL